ncbi:hypothetical protein IMCC13023_03550 [Candidatus Aquiluna sp. IMCC13023]|uniref:lysylphosphatidylglycerol synthase domain-containing protein n=1 Tax=Candidatus Aquiluna sp. IMCC13023 TaxID=1081644 RepID=UPI00025B20C0|nr:lysylphosphatidylglycerol synthase domain-containing protein [Candidatus Aquiluna sp. IMCC13023]EIC91876.1 hypothetical protein IMCC13023_03550 [Candidatus Aquiluna sp. IMCC13023]
MKSAGLHRLYVLSSRVFTFGLIVAAIWILVSQRDVLLNTYLLGLSIVSILIFHMCVQVSAVASTQFFRRQGFAALFSTQLSLNYRSHMAAFVTPAVLGSALKLKRLASRHSPGHALWYLIQERVFTFLWSATFGLTATLVLGEEVLGQTLSQVLVWSLGGGMVLSLLFGVLFPRAFKPIYRRLPRRAFSYLAKMPNFKDVKIENGARIVASYTLIISVLGAAGVLAVGYALWPMEPAIFLLARAIAFLISTVPLPIPAVAAGELGSIALLVLMGIPADVAALSSSIFIMGIFSGAVVGIIYEILMLIRKG